jgi:hypothetical protein
LFAADGHDVDSDAPRKAFYLNSCHEGNAPIADVEEGATLLAPYRETVVVFRLSNTNTLALFEI